MAEVMSINTEAVGAAINQISVYTADIATRNKKFLELLSEKNKATQGKFQLLKTLEEKLGTTLVISDKAPATLTLLFRLRKKSEQHSVDTLHSLKKLTMTVRSEFKEG